MKKFAILAIFGLFLLIIPVVFLPDVSAQITGIPGLVNNIEIADDQAVVGDILSNTGEGIFRSASGYDAQMIGVVVESPVISIGEKTGQTVPVISSGRAMVNVTAGNGAIKAGDFITSSDTAGVGQKGTAAGYMLGKALVSYEDTSQSGKIPVLVNIGYFSAKPDTAGFWGSLLDFLNRLLQEKENLPLILRYLAAALVAIATFGFATFSFLRFMRNGIEAIGRNPLAKRVIIWGMIINALIVGLLAIAGFGIAFAIVVF